MVNKRKIGINKQKTTNDKTENVKEDLKQENGTSESEGIERDVLYDNDIRLWRSQRLKNKRLTKLNLVEDLVNKRVRFITNKSFNRCQLCKASLSLITKMDKTIICKICNNNPLGFERNVFLEDIYDYHAKKMWLKNNDANKIGKSILKESGN